MKSTTIWEIYNFFKRIFGTSKVKWKLKQVHILWDENWETWADDIHEHMNQWRPMTAKSKCVFFTLDSEKHRREQNFIFSISGRGKPNFRIIFHLILWWLNKGSSGGQLSPLPPSAYDLAEMYTTNWFYRISTMIACYVYFIHFNHFFHV